MLRVAHALGVAWGEPDHGGADVDDGDDDLLEGEDD